MILLIRVVAVSKEASSDEITLLYGGIHELNLAANEAGTEAGLVVGFSGLRLSSHSPHGGPARASLGLPARFPVDRSTLRVRPEGAVASAQHLGVGWEATTSGTGGTGHRGGCGCCWACDLLSG